MFVGVCGISRTHNRVQSKKAVVTSLYQRVSDMNRIHSAQVAAVLKGEGLLFQEEFAAAFERKEAAKYAVVAHRQQHGC